MEHWMNLLVLVLICLFFSIPDGFADIADIEDPYVDIEQTTAPNGINFVYAPAPSAKTFSIKIRVRAGTLAETEKNAGVAHFLEHYLFTDSRLKNNSSYLDLIKELGGTGNGATSSLETVYYAKVPSGKAELIAKMFGKMLFNRTFEQDRVDQTRKPVLLEIGEPGLMAYLWRTGFLKIVYPDFLKLPDFWQSEFGLEPIKSTSLAAEQSNTLSISAHDLKTFYDEYYHPSNITVYFAGKFNSETMKSIAQKWFASTPARKGKTVEQRATTIRKSPFLRTTSTSGTPRIAVGTKFWDATLEDLIVIDIYVEYLAHRLMKEFRNRKGETYTARGIVNNVKNFGQAVVTLETPAAQYSNNLRYIRNVIHEEAETGNLTEEQFAEAMKLYSTHYNLTDRDSSTALRLAENAERNNKVFGRSGSEFLIFKSLTFQDFTARLTKLFNSNQRYSVLLRPPLVWRYELAIIIVIFTITMLFFAKMKLTVPFEHSKVRLVRKLACPPLHLIEIISLSLGSVLAQYLSFGIRWGFFKSNFIQSSVLLSDYLYILIEMAFIIVSCIIVLKLTVRKLIICGDYLYIKSITYFAKRIPLTEIKSIELLHLWEVVFSMHRLSGLGFGQRFSYYDPLFLRPGLYLRFKDGSSGFFSVKDAATAIDEFKQYLVKDEAKLKIAI
ncbi:MAG: insulinase family protein [Bdellovibrio sp.]|nr:insulinase family protein [Bdellovibrio sp.]